MFQIAEVSFHEVFMKVELLRTYVDDQLLFNTGKP
jgi:hypothetical protein